MDTNKDRSEQQVKSQTHDQQKPKRFRLVRLEERIAPSYSGGGGNPVAQAGSGYCTNAQSYPHAYSAVQCPA